MHGCIQKARSKTDGIHDKSIAFPVPDGMPRPRKFDVLWMILQLHVDRSLQTELAVLDHDRIFVLRDAVDRTIKRPIEDDARGFAAKAWIVFAFEIRRSLCTEVRQFASAIKTRPRRSGSACTAAT